METKVLKELAVYFVNKGYISTDSITDSDDLYNATDAEKDECMVYVREIIDQGMIHFKLKNGVE